MDNNITIPVERFEELIKTETQYNYLYSLLYNHFKNEFQGLFDYLDDIDLDKFKELSKNKEEIKWEHIKLILNI